MPACSFCKARPADSEEHIVLNALGGRRKVLGFVCEPCNNRLGATVDASFEEALRMVSLVTGCIRGDNKPIASKEFVFEDGTKRRILPGGLSEIPRPYELKVGGEFLTALSRYDPAEIARIVERPLRRLRGEGELQVTMEVVPREEDRHVDFPIALGDPSHFRCVAKMGLSAMAKRGALPWGAADFESCVAFIMGETEVWHRGFGSVDDAGLRKQFGSHPGQHVLALYDEDSQWEAIFLVFGYLPIRVAMPIPSTLIGPIAHVVDPIPLQTGKGIGTHEVREFEHMRMGRVQDTGATVGEANKLAGRFLAWQKWAHDRARENELARKRANVVFNRFYDGLADEVRSNPAAVTLSDLEQLANAMMKVMDDPEAPLAERPDLAELTAEIQRLLSNERATS